MRDGFAVDKWLFLAVAALLAIGVTMVLSTSYLYSQERFGDGTYFFRKQLIAMGAGLLHLHEGRALGHDDRHGVPEHPGDDGQTNPRIARGPFDDFHTGFELPLGDGVRVDALVSDEGDREVRRRNHRLGA